MTTLDVMASIPKQRVYRLRNLPEHLDGQSAAELLASCIDGFSIQHIRISSLAETIDPWSRQQTKTATLLFEDCTLDPLSGSQNERTFSIPGLRKALILDDHFQGLTPLNEVDQEVHQHE